MSLMKLAPEAVRLRRVARAHALGEFSLAEYRAARREVIDNFQPDAVSDDDTQPREANGSPDGLADSPAQAAMQSPGRAERRPARRRKWLVWLLTIVALLTATQLLAAAAEFRIAPVAERDPNPATSPRLAVTEVVLADQPLLDELSVSREALEAVIGETLAEIRARNQPGSHGFTQSELEEVGRLLSVLGAHEGELTAADAAELSALLADQKARRGVSVVELEEVAAAVQQHLRDAGYPLAAAYLPAQVIGDGRVEVAILPGVLGEVQVIGASDRLARRFNDLRGTPVTAQEINTRLYALNQAPGLSARASFEPAEQVGETRLVLDVLERRALLGSIAVDNHGDSESGRQRVLVRGGFVNPSGRGDVLRLGLNGSVDPDNQLLGFAEYATPVGYRRQLRARVARNEFNTGSASGIDSTAWVFDGVVETYLRRDRLAGLSWEMGIGRHDIDWETAQDGIGQQVSVISGALNGRRVWDSFRLATTFRIHADAGDVGGDTFAGQKDRFWDLGAELFGWHPLNVPLLPGRQKVAVRITGQLANTQLPATLRMPLGGYAGARGFDRDIYLADQGFLIRGDLRTPVALGELVFFGDIAYGKVRNEQLPGWAHLANLGLAWEIQLDNGFTSALALAQPVTAKGSGGLDDDGTRLFWSISYSR